MTFYVHVRNIKAKINWHFQKINQTWGTHLNELLADSSFTSSKMNSLYNECCRHGTDHTHRTAFNNLHFICLPHLTSPDAFQFVPTSVLIRCANYTPKSMKSFHRKKKNKSLTLRTYIRSALLHSRIQINPDKALRQVSIYVVSA